MTGLCGTPRRSSLLEELERRHDDAPPRSAVRTALLEGAERHAALARAAALRLHDRLAAEAAGAPRNGAAPCPQTARAAMPGCPASPAH
ncbi:hypothetical protein [Azospirillum argentinense]